jgi:TatD DNase family protein
VIFDTHCHLGHDGESASDVDAVRARAAASGVSLMLDVGTDLESSLGARAIAARLCGVLWSAGLHPNDSAKLEDEWDAIEALCRRADCAAVGETGLDHFRQWAAPQQQARAFARHLALAVEIDKPVIVHCRAAFPAVFDILAAHPGARGVMHCFSGGIDEARRALALGFHVSFAGPLTYPKNDALRAVAAWLPDDRVLVETDAPFLPPQGRRGQRNEPAYIVATVQALADARKSSFAAAAALTAANGRALFALPAPPHA